MNWYTPRPKPIIEYTPLNYFKDSLGQTIERGDVIAYATEYYDTVYLRVAEVVDINIRENLTRWSNQKWWIKVKPEGKSPRMIHGPQRTVLVTKSQTRLTPNAVSH